MTRLESRSRRQSARKIQSPAKQKREAKPTPKANRLGWLVQSRPRQKSMDLSPDVKPTLSRETEFMMKMTTMSLLADRGGSCSMAKIAGQLAVDPKLKDSHAKPPPSRGLLHSLRQSCFSMKSGTQRRYQLTNALNRVKTAPGALSTVMDSWAQVKEILSGEMQFDESEERPDDTAIERLLSPSPKAPSTPIPFHKDELEPSPSYEKWQQISAVKPPRKIAEQSSEDKGAIEKELEIERAKKEEAERQKQAEFEEIQRQIDEATREEEARQAATSMLRDFTEEEEEIVRDAIHGYGPADQNLQQEGPDSVQRQSMQKLAPGQWLNDEVIHFFLLMLQKRDAELCRNDPDRKRSHFFKSFFITKLLNEGHIDPAMDGMYEYRNVKRWSKKVPGKDIFKLDKIVFPINEGRMHWVCAVAFMQEKRIQFYDSMGADGRRYLDHIFRYIQDEHKDKKKAPLPDIDEWELVVCTEDTPRQGNGFDCGVFCCTFADFLSMDYPLTFTQEHINKCRKRIALSIMRGQAIV